MLGKLKLPLSVKLGLAILLLLSSGILLFKINYSDNRNLSTSPVPLVNKINSLNIPTPTPSPTPTPKPLTFAEMNALYGPCVKLPTLMYHHVQSKDQAAINKQTSLSVYTEIFKEQMQYLKDKGYSPLSMSNLVNFFDSSIGIPSKSILITFDDAYQDFYTDAYPILRDLGFKATVFVPTGLVNNGGYLSWSEINEMSSLVEFSNHTWSHRSVLVSTSEMNREITTADTQLTEKNLNAAKVFAYPYGPDTIESEKFLNDIGYKLAFTTKPGSVLCKKQRFSLPRIRIGNAPLSSYGF